MRLPVAEDDRVAIRRRTRNAAGADGAARSGRVFDDHGLPERTPHPLGEDARQRVGRPTCREGHDDRDRPPRIGLGAGREWPRRRTPEQGDELAPLHSITSSARASSVAGTVMPSALAVFILMTSWKRVRCSTGKSAGWAPLRILST